MYAESVQTAMCEAVHSCEHPPLGVCDHWLTRDALLNIHKLTGRAAFLRAVVPENLESMSLIIFVATFLLWEPATPT